MLIIQWLYSREKRCRLSLRTEKSLERVLTNLKSVIISEKSRSLCRKSTENKKKRWRNKNVGINLLNVSHLNGNHENTVEFMHDLKCEALSSFYVETVCTNQHRSKCEPKIICSMRFDEIYRVQFKREFIIVQYAWISPLIITNSGWMQFVRIHNCRLYTFSAISRMQIESENKNVVKVAHMKIDWMRKETHNCCIFF